MYKDAIICLAVADVIGFVLYTEISNLFKEVERSAAGDVLMPRPQQLSLMFASHHQATETHSSSLRSAFSPHGFPGLWGQTNKQNKTFIDPALASIASKSLHSDLSEEHVERVHTREAERHLGFFF